MNFFQNTRIIAVLFLTFVFALSVFTADVQKNSLTFLIRALEVSAQSSLSCYSNEVDQYFFNKYYSGSGPFPRWQDYMTCTNVATHTWDTYNANAASYNSVACGAPPINWGFTCAQVEEALSVGSTIPDFSKIYFGSTGEYNSFQIQAVEQSCSEDGNPSYQCSTCYWQLRPGYTFLCGAFGSGGGGPGPTVTLTANPTSVMTGQNSTLTWTVSGGASICTASGDWSGSKSVSGGSEVRSNLTTNKTYTIECSNSNGTNSDSATVTVGNPPGSPSGMFDLEAGTNSPYQNSLSGTDSLNNIDGWFELAINSECGSDSDPTSAKCQVQYKLDCTNDGTWDRQATRYNYANGTRNWLHDNACNYGVGNHTMRGEVTITKNSNPAISTTYTDTVPITVTSTVTTPSLTYDLEAGLDLATASDSFVGDAPVTGLDAVHYMNIQGCATETSPYEDKCTLEYRVDCTNDGTWEAPQITFAHGWNDGVWKAWNYQVADICDYPTTGTYTMRGEVRVSKNSDPSLVAVGGDTVDVTVNDVLTCNGPSTGTGITGDYFDGTNFETLITADVLDATINFANMNPVGTSRANGDNTFSVRWDGYLEPQCSETYTLTSRTDDGVRVWLDTNLDGTFSSGEQVINRWVNQAATTINGTPVSLTKGQKYPIRMEYYENCCGAVAQLSWSSASTPQEIIPQTQLFPDDAVPPVSVTISPDTQTVDIGDNASFTTSITGGVSPYTCSWVAIGGTPSSGNSCTFSTSYSSAGNKTVSVTATDSGGLNDTDTATVVVDDPTPPPPPPVYSDLTVVREGQGTVTSSIAGITCGGDCAETYEDGTAVVLTATVTSGTDWFFVSWDNCPNPVGNQCNLTVNGDQTITAKFRNDYKIQEI